MLIVVTNYAIGRVWQSTGKATRIFDKNFSTGVNEYSCIIQRVIFTKPDELNPYS